MYNRINSEAATTQSLQVTRRGILKWSAPIVTAVALPAHAVMSQCSGPPVLTVVAAPKCSGDPPVGTAVIEVAGPDECDMEIKSITFTTSDPKSELNSFPNFPVVITDTSPISFTWIGPASDAITCLPLAQIDATIEYCCEDGVILTETVNITELLINSVP